MTKGNPKFKPGDVVTVRLWDDMGKEYGYDGYDSDSLIRCPCEYGTEAPICYFRENMRCLCGTEVHISETVWLSDHALYAYHIEEYDPDKYFVETMFEPEPMPEIPAEEIEAFYS